MTNTVTPNFVLGIEAAVSGGSLAILRDSRLFAEWQGGEAVSRAEDILPNIDRLLKNTALELADLTTIAVSAGPGSFTGIRIGIATALGLAKACSLRVVKISVLRAMAAGVGSPQRAAVVPVGRGMFAAEVFGSDASGPILLSADALAEWAESLPETVRITVPENASELVRLDRAFPIGNLAAALANASHDAAADHLGEPIFLSKTR